MADQAAVTLVTGPEELLAERAVATLVRRVRDEDADADVRDLPAAGLAAGVVTELTSPSLFGERKVIVVRGLQDAGDPLVAELKAYVAAPAADVVLALTHRGGQRGRGVLDAARKAGAVEVVCAEVKSRRDRVGFLMGEFAGQHRRTTNEAAETLLDAIGVDLRSLAAAVDQLCADTSGTVDVDVVRRYYAGHAEVSGFTVADRAMEGRADEALLQLRYAVAGGTDPVLVVSALAMALRAIVRVAAAPRGLREADLAKELGMPP